MKNLPDIQNTQTGFPKIPIEKVGIRNIIIPLAIRRKDETIFYSTATISSYCSLVENVKGINMSRISRTIVDVLSNTTKCGFDNLTQFTNELQMAHQSDDIYIKAKFTYLLEYTSPITHLKSYEPVDVVMESVLQIINGKKTIKNYLTVTTTEMSLCPCSKEMSLLHNNVTDNEQRELQQLSLELQNKINKSGFGAHNQKSIIRTTVEVIDSFYIEDLVDIIKQSSSCPTFTVLKRPDEKWVTEVSYMGGYYDENKQFIKVGDGDQYGPRFVEDISRLIAQRLNLIMDNTISDYVVVVNNDESIHSGELKATSILTAGRTLK